MKEVSIKITCCEKCPNVDYIPINTGDWFRDDTVKWVCKFSKRKDNVICPYHETFDPNPKIPNWCPIKKK
jgi:hypothetical protein